MTQIVLHAHLSADAILRPDLASGGECLSGHVEQAGHRVLTADQLRAWCGRPDVSIVVKPVIDLHQRLETHRYTPTVRIRDHVIARDRRRVLGSDATPSMKRSCDEEVHQTGLAA